MQDMYICNATLFKVENVNNLEHVPAIPSDQALGKLKPINQHFGFTMLEVDQVLVLYCLL